MEKPGFAEIEIVSSDSDNTTALPAITFKRYLRPTGVQYINMGQTSKVQNDPKWDLEETVRQVKQKFATVLKQLVHYWFISIFVKFKHENIC